MTEIGEEVETRRRLPFRGRGLWRAFKPIAIAILALLLLYYPIGMIWVHQIDDDIDFVAPTSDLGAGASAVVAMAAALIDREVNQHRWVANDPFFEPPTLLDNMPNYQQGIIGALARFAFELTDQIGRTRGSSQTDPDLQEAAGLLQYSGTKWIFDFSTSIAPTATSEAQYRKARRSLIDYNQRLAAGEAVFERRADNLLATLDRIALDLGSSSAVLDRRIAEHAGAILDFQADDLFYGVKGQVYAYYMLVRELGHDFDKVIRERELEAAWGQLLDSMRHVVELDPWVVVNGAPDGQFLPNHLAAQGFYLLRARTQLREITNILLK
ncbi:MAG: DUF2333 family protein [Alphaproteobacteria bacterium]